MLELAMAASELDEMLELKRSMLIFSLCMQDQGLTTPQDKMHQDLVKLHSHFLDKLVQKVRSTVKTLLDSEQYQQNVVENDEQFAYAVERFEFELFDHFKTNKVVVSSDHQRRRFLTSRNLVCRNNTRSVYHIRDRSWK